MGVLTLDKKNANTHISSSVIEQDYPRHTLNDKWLAKEHNGSKNKMVKSKPTFDEQLAKYTKEDEEKQSGQPCHATKNQRSYLPPRPKVPRLNLQLPHWSFYIIF